MEFLSYSDLDNQFVFLGDVDFSDFDFKKPRLIRFTDEDLSNIRVALTIIDENYDLFKYDFEDIFSSVRTFLNITK